MNDYTRIVFSPKQGRLPVFLEDCLESLNKKTSLEVLEFFASDLFEKFTEFGILKIEKDKVVLKPYLLK